jgi:hypothetical protein
MGNPIEVMGERAMLDWIGEKHYATAEEFTAEARERGFSRRIGAVPHGFVVGKTWVLVAHPKGCAGTCDGCNGTALTQQTGPGTFAPHEGEGPEFQCQACVDTPGEMKVPGIFSAFRPRQAQYVCKGDETPNELDELLARGLTPVKVNPVDDDGNPVNGEDD